MNQPATLFFPDTTKVPETATGLLLLFNKIFYYLPVEPESESAEQNDFLCEKGLYQGYAPAPLGDDRDRFDRTIRELQGNLYDYGERLRGLSVASLTAAGLSDNDETSVSSLVSAILPSHEQKTEKNSAAAKEQHYLWQARIVLKLAEDFDRKKEEIDARLAELSQSEDTLLSSLIGDDTDDELEKTPPVTDGGLRTRTDPSGQRLKAWSHLFLADSHNNQTPAPCILSTTRRDVVDIVFDAYEKRCRQQPRLLFSIPVPNLQDMNGDELVSNLDAFRTEAQGILDQVGKMLIDAAMGARKCPTAQEEHVEPDWLAAWSEPLGQHFPSSGDNHGRLTVYCLADTSLTELLAQMLNLTGDEETVLGRFSTGLIALLEA